MVEKENAALSSEDRELVEKILGMRLKVLYRETGETKVFTLAEAKEWDWSNPEIWRIANGWQITTFQRLLKLLYLKAKKGYDEIEILEAPRFTMLSGG
ncbi:MAG: hypothetical protein N2745_11470 [Syntrophorhabdaceae bacterium]|nr:hypothetical protein [Syntrophorhabdaceae bacterium]